MIRVRALVGRFPGLTAEELADWLARGWIKAESEAEGEWVFAEVEVSRVALILDLRRMAVEDETLPVVLSLVDQVQALRVALGDVLRALEAEPLEVREHVLATLGKRS